SPCAAGRRPLKLAARAMAAASAGNIIAASGRAAGSPDADAGKATPTDRRPRFPRHGRPTLVGGHRIVSRNWPLQLMRSVLIERATVSLSGEMPTPAPRWTGPSLNRGSEGRRHTRLGENICLSSDLANPLSRSRTDIRLLDKRALSGDAEVDRVLRY